MRVDLVSTGDEIVWGEIVDTNAAKAASRLTEHGYFVGRHYTCGDDFEALTQTIRVAIENADAVICSGGLGPTQDDRTLDAAAFVFKAELDINPGLLERLAGIFERFGTTLTDSQKRQARLPQGAAILDNPAGTATGVLMEKGRRMLFCLPGPPKEFEPMLHNQVLSHLEARRTQLGCSRQYAQLTLRTVGKSEGWIADTLADLEDRFEGLRIGYRAVMPEVHIKLRVRGKSLDSIQKTLLEAQRSAREKLGDCIYASGDTTLPATLIHMLSERGLKLAVAESCTGGLVGKLLTDVPGASKVFCLSAVTYADEMKINLLKVPQNTIHKHGAVSAECAVAMAHGIRRLSCADLGLSITGIAGPGGGTLKKPVGTVFIALADSDGARIVTRNFPIADRETIRCLSAYASLDLVRKKLLDNQS